MIQKTLMEPKYYLEDFKGNGHDIFCYLKPKLVNAMWYLFPFSYNSIEMLVDMMKALQKKTKVQVKTKARMILEGAEKQIEFILREAEETAEKERYNFCNLRISLSQNKSSLTCLLS